MDSPGQRPWSDLPIEILEFFLDRLFFSDHNRFSAVCKPWMTAAARHRPPPIPWLVPSQDPATQIWTFYSPVHGRSYRLKLPVAPGGRCFGSSHGWLFMADDVLGHHLLNPCTNEQFQLPPPSAPDRVYCRSRYNLYRAVMSSPQDRVAVAICDHGLAYCKPRDIVWSPFPNFLRNYFVQDILLYKGLLYSINDLWVITVFKFRPQPKVKAVYRPMPPPEKPPDHERRKFYLVDCAGELLMIARYQKRSGSLYRTITLHVFSLNRDATKWVPVESLAGAMLFLGTGCSRSFTAESNPAFRPNCICFVDDICFVFCLEDGGIQPYNPDNPSLLLQDDAIWAT